MKGMRTLRKSAVIAAVCMAVLCVLGCNNSTKAEQEQVFKGGEDTVDKFLKKGAYIKIYGKGVTYRLAAQIISISIGENGVSIYYGYGLNGGQTHYYDVSEYRIFLDKDCNIIIKPRPQKEVSKEKQIKERTERLAIALRSTITTNNLERAKLCIKSGANVNAKNDRGNTMLMLTIDKGNKDIADLLIKSGADVNAKDNGGGTAIMWAASRGYKDIAELLIKAGADVNARNNDGETALGWAIRYKKKDVAEILIKAGADVDSALIHTIWQSAEEYPVELFIQLGANPNAKDSAGISALTYATMLYGNNRIADLLRAAGAKE